MDIRTRISAGLLSAALLSGIVALAPAAQAGGSCTLGCSETHNDSSLGMVAGRDWCSTGTLCSGSQTKWLSPHQTTPPKQDWDAFRVDGGWCYTVLWYDYGVYINQKFYDRRNKGNLWVQVHNYETAQVIEQSGSACVTR
ncbi:hypothetical protein [Streptomyces sp. NPDC050528]|uniref:hypothetical protein n=1 Tax=unclassified Streptomyces TaxID=2593676 RepID=UPI0037AF13B2